MYEIFEHTADLGLRIYAPDLSGLFAEGARALFSVLVENLEAVECREAHSVHLENENLEYLFFDWLDQLLYLFDAHKLVLVNFDVNISASDDDQENKEHTDLKNPTDLSGQENKFTKRWQLSAIVKGEKLDRQRHVLDHEVKAITYHGLKVEQTSTGWLAEVIVDI